LINRQISESNLPFSDNILTNYSFVDSIQTDEELVWYFDKGIVRMKFDINKNHDLVSVDWDFIGKLGNEIIHL
jgi:hypothetical protein